MLLPCRGEGRGCLFIGVHADSSNSLRVAYASCPVPVREADPRHGVRVPVPAGHVRVHECEPAQDPTPQHPAVHAPGQVRGVLPRCIVLLMLVQVVQEKNGNRTSLIET